VLKSQRGYHGISERDGARGDFVRLPKSPLLHATHRKGAFVVGSHTVVAYRRSSWSMVTRRIASSSQLKQKAALSNKRVKSPFQIRVS